MSLCLRQWRMPPKNQTQRKRLLRVRQRTRHPLRRLQRPLRRLQRPAVSGFRRASPTVSLCSLQRPLRGLQRLLLALDQCLALRPALRAPAALPGSVFHLQVLLFFHHLHVFHLFVHQLGKLPLHHFPAMTPRQSQRQSTVTSRRATFSPEISRRMVEVKKMLSGLTPSVEAKM